MCATLYNTCLEERIDCYRKTGESRSYYDQCKALTEVRANDPEYADISVQVFRGVVGRIDKAYKRFFRHGGFPRFKSSGRWRTIEINDQCWGMLKREGQKLVLKIKGLPRIEVKTERELPPNTLLKAIRITRKPLRTEVALSYGLPTPEAKPVDNPVGIDMGISKRLALSNGETVEKRELDRRSCGLVLDRDVNAAINILRRGISIAGGKLKQSRMVGRMREKQDSGLARPRTVEVTI